MHFFCFTYKDNKAQKKLSHLLKVRSLSTSRSEDWIQISEFKTIVFSLHPWALNYFDYTSLSVKNILDVLPQFMYLLIAHMCYYIFIKHIQKVEIWKR